MRACCAPLCVLSVRPPDDRDERIVNRYWGKKEKASNALTSSFIGGSDLYATRFSDRFRAFLYILCTLIFFEGVRGMEVGTPSDFCFGCLVGARRMVKSWNRAHR